MAVSLNLKSLIETLDKTCTDALQGAAGLCLSRTHATVELEHWLLKLIEDTDNDLARIFRHVEVDPGALQADLNAALNRFKTGNDRTPSLSPQIDELVREAWLLSSIQYGQGAVRSGTLLVALLTHERLGRVARDISPELKKIKADALVEPLLAIVDGSIEDGEVAAQSVGSPATAVGAGTGAGAGDGVPSKASKTPALDQFTIDLTARAQEGKIDPVLCRDGEVRQMVDILIRRRQNNPILTGEAGVGKTAVVEGFALRIARGDVPEVLRSVVVRTLDLGLLQAGAGVKGEFENRLKQVIEEVKGSDRPIILFIDEAHTLIGAGGQAGQGDAANLLKPALARGELRTIAATTWAEYKKYFEKDAALARRFQVVKVEEPDQDKATLMMRAMADVLQKHHGVRILDEAVDASVRLSARFLTGRQLPDKSLSLLDTSCARVAIGQRAIPPLVEDLRRTIDALKTEVRILEAERATGTAHDERLEQLRESLEHNQGRLREEEARWEQEMGLVTQVQELRNRIEAWHGEQGADDGRRPAPTPEIEADRAKLQELSEQLRTIQGDHPLMPVCVDEQVVAEVISGWTGIPAGRMLADEIRQVLELKETLRKRVIGQDTALEAIGQRIWTARANLTDPRRPIGVFLLVGPSGVGKTESALALAEALYGGERNLITINMSEYQESHTVSSLKGSPPGYVGYGEGGVLTEAVRRKPYSVVLLDEVEKAHPDVMELFYQVFDKGMLEDGEGREIDFKNTVILLTSNVGSDLTISLNADPETAPSAEGMSEALQPELLKAFPAALLGRMIVVPYMPITDENLARIIRLQLDRIGRRLQDHYKVPLEYGEDLVAAVSERCKQVETGARAVDHILTRTLLPEISRTILARMAEGTAIEHVKVAVGDDGAFQYEIR